MFIDPLEMKLVVRILVSSGYYEATMHYEWLEAQIIPQPQGKSRPTINYRVIGK